MTESDTQIEAALTALHAEFGDRLDDVGITRVHEQLTAIAATSKTLAAAPLANGDEPMSVFQAQAKG